MNAEPINPTAHDAYAGLEVAATKIRDAIKHMEKNDVSAAMRLLMAHQVVMEIINARRG